VGFARLGILHPLNAEGGVVWQMGRGAHAMRNEVAEEVLSDLVGEICPQPDDTHLLGVRTSGVGSKSGSR
jgi:hypothetical protein